MGSNNNSHGNGPTGVESETKHAVATYGGRRRRSRRGRKTRTYNHTGHMKKSRRSRKSRRR